VSGERGGICILSITFKSSQFSWYVRLVCSHSYCICLFSVLKLVFLTAQLPSFYLIQTLYLCNHDAFPADPFKNWHHLWLRSVNFLLLLLLPDAEGLKSTLEEGRVDYYPRSTGTTWLRNSCLNGPGGPLSLLHPFQMTTWAKRYLAAAEDGNRTA
jgi:hypothetical protein